MASTSVIEISEDAVRNNISFIRNLVGEKVIIASVIKGNAYGHGTELMVRAFEKVGIGHFCVYSSAEAKDAFMAASKNSVIIIMGYIAENDFHWVMENNIQFYVSELTTLNTALDFARSLNLKAHIHIDVETGMYRTGLTLPDLKKAVTIINSNPDHLNVVGIASHLAGAESIANYYRIKKQHSTFNKRCRLIEESGIKSAIKHLASSAATIVYPKTRLDMVRVGVLQYGYWPTRETFIRYISKQKSKENPLMRSLRWSSQVISVKNIPEGEFVGYGLAFQAQSKIKVMLIPVGYCNGYSRSLSNNGRVLVRGQFSQVIGSVNMNMILCDVTNVDDVAQGDEVVLIGKQGDNEITFSSFAEMNNAMNYEILARLPENIDRKLKDN